MKEVWKSIEGFEGFYQISNFGKVKSLSRKTKTKNGRLYTTKTKLMKVHVTSRGYPAVRLTANNKTSIYLIHRLIAIAFIENPENKEYVNHMDGDKENNSLSNLEWVTPTENSSHAWETGLMKCKTIGEKHHSAKLTEKEVRYIRSMDGIKTIGDIAEEFNITKQSVGQIINRKTWRHIS